MSKTITLPNRDEMLTRLTRVNNTEHLQQHFYPILLKSAGKELVSEGVVMMLVLAINDYTKDLSRMVADLVYDTTPEFIDALVVDDEAAKETKVLLQQALSHKAPNEHSS